MRFAQTLLAILLAANILGVGEPVHWALILFLLVVIAASYLYESYVEYARRNFFIKQMNKHLNDTAKFIAEHKTRED